jgi:hypothetical protein
VLVVTGDLIDKWSGSLEVIALLRRLQSDAADQGGRVIITMGNHEAEFLANPLGKKTKEFRSELTAADFILTASQRVPTTPYGSPKQMPTRRTHRRAIDT